MKLISCENLSFYYGKEKILNGIDFEVDFGDVIGIAGQNGCGKSSLLNIIDSKYKCSYLRSNMPFYNDLTGYDNLKYFCLLNRVSFSKISDLVKLVGLDNILNKKYGSYSLGNKQKLAIVLTLLRDADIYLFDEPLNGLDPFAIINFRTVIDYLKSLNKTIIIVSHIISEFSYYCNKIWVVKDGRIAWYDISSFNEKIIKEGL